MPNKKQNGNPLSNPLAGALLAAGAALGIAILWSFPLVLSPAQSILGPPGDSLTALSRWEHWHFSGRYVERPLLNAMGLVISRLFGPIAAYNILLISSFPLAAVTSFLLFNRLVRNRAAAVVASLLFALCPFHWARSQGHLYLAHIQWIPLVVLSIVVFVSRPSVAGGIAFVAAFGLLFSSSFYYGFFGTLIGLALFVPAIGYVSATRQLRRYWGIGFIVVLAVVGTLPITFSYLRWLSAWPPPRTELIEELFRYSARMREYVLPASFSGLARLWLPSPAVGSLHRSNEVEQTLFIGWIPLALAAFGFAMTIRHPLSRGRPAHREEESTPLRWIFAAGAVALILSAPPAVSFLGKTVFLPNYYASRVVPFFRCYARMAIFVQLSVCAAAAVCLSRISERRHGGHILFLLLILAMIEFTPVPPTRVSRLLPPKPVYLWKVWQNSKANIVEFPFNSRATPRTSCRDFYQQFHGRSSLEEIAPFDLRHAPFLDAQRCVDLAAAGVEFVIVHHRSPEPLLLIYKDRPERGRNRPGPWPAVDLKQGLGYVAHFPGSIVLSPKPADPGVTLTRSDGVQPWAEGIELVGAPVRSTAGFLLQNRGRIPARASVELTLLRVHPVQAWSVSLNGAFWALVPQHSDTLMLRAEGLELLPDINALQFQALDAALSPIPIGSADPVSMLLEATIVKEMIGDPRENGA